MIEFESVTVKNFVSVGDNPVTIELNRSPSTLLTGKNGNGKSSIIVDSITFALFGKSYRGVNKPALINTINQRDCVATIKFKKGQDSYSISRGMKPNKLEILKNGELVDEAAAIRDTQSYIEKDILGFDYSSFTKVCILSTMNYTPFMQLSTNERRNLVETMLSLTCFSEMNKLHKSKVSTYKDLMTQLQSSLEVKKALYDEKLKSVNRTNQKDEDQVARIKADITSLSERVKQVKVQKKEFEDELEALVAENLQQMYEEGNRESIHLLSKIAEEKSNISFAYKKLKFFTDNSVCGSCDQSIDPEYKGKHIDHWTYLKEDHTLRHGVHTKAKQDLSEDLVKINDKLKRISTLKQNIEIKTNQIEQISKQAKARIKDLETIKTDSDLDSLKTDLLLVKGELKSYAQQFDTMIAQKEINSVITDVLKDTGVKSSIIKQYIPILVGFTNKYLEMMNISIKFNMDENFNETITTRFANEYVYSNLSMGERGRLDCALTFAWRQVAKLKGSVYTNLLVLDEILDASLDSNGTEDIMSILEEVCENENVFIISHKNNLDEKVRSVIRLEKVNGFTKIVV